MKLMPVKEVRRFYPPFKNDLADILDWLKPVNVVIKGEFLSGGVLVSPNVIAVTGAMGSPEALVQLPNGKKVKATKSPYSNKEMFLSFYTIEEGADWVGLPNWDGDVELDTMFFSYIPIRRERVIMWNPIQNAESESAEKCKKNDKVKLSADNFEHTFPVVDQFGYFVGLAIGTSEGECTVQLITFKKSPL
jgi:hypothetical protein